MRDQDYVIIERHGLLVVEKCNFVLKHTHTHTWALQYPGKTVTLI